MSWLKVEMRFQIVSIFLWIEGVLLLFWWPMSHWFYPDLYHRILGFTSGSYPDAMVKIIGSCGFLIVALIFFAALNPRKNRDIIISIIFFALLISITYIYLIITMQFPVLEFVNVAISLISTIILVVFYPWKSSFNIGIDCWIISISIFWFL